MITEKGIVPVKGGQYKVLSEKQIEDLHRATVQVLEDVGVKILHQEALELMRTNGCRVDFDQQVAKIPEDVMMKHLELAPTQVTLYGRDPKYDLTVDDSDNCHVMGGAGALHYIDLDGNRRESTLAALEDFTRLEDTCQNMDI